MSQTVRIKNIAQAVTMDGPHGCCIGRGTLGVVDDAIILVDGDKIKGVYPSEHAPAEEPSETIVDAGGAVVLPGLIDPHTHAVFGGSREQEFEMRTEGRSYLEIARAGGGILSTVKATQNATPQELYESGRRRLERMLKLGVTTVEVKSGYGLNTETEIKQLEVIQRLGVELPMTVVPTFMGAHALPPAYKSRAEAYVDLVCKEMIPEVAKRKLAVFCDVFCEEGFFSNAQSRRILETAKEHGLELKIHADEFKDLGGARLAAELGATSADHLLAVSEDGIAALAQSEKTVAVLLPATAFFLGAEYGPAKKLKSAGVTVALSTDFNPGSSFTENLPLVITMACTQMKMSVAQALHAVTVGGAAALGLNDRGCIRSGMRADLSFFEIPHYAYLPYHFGANFITRVMVGGETVLEREAG